LRAERVQLPRYRAPVPDRCPCSALLGTPATL
jgi:hypothetical protein